MEEKKEEINEVVENQEENENKAEVEAPRLESQNDTEIEAPNVSNQPEHAELIQQQADQTHYINKLDSILQKEEITDDDLQNIEYCKSALLTQILSVGIFAGGANTVETTKLAAETLSSHLSKLYAKAAKVSEKAAEKRRFQVEKLDVADAYFGPNKRKDYVTDSMLIIDEKKITADLRKLVGLDGKVLNLKKMVTDPIARLKAAMPSLTSEFQGNLTPDENAKLTSWTSNLVNALSLLGSQKEMQNALQGVNNSLAILKQATGSKNI